MRTTQQAIIVSAELAGNDQNATRTQYLRNSLTDLDLVFNEALGLYKGHQEVSFVILPRDNDEIDTVKALAFNAFKQEAVLFQDNQGQAQLIFSDNSTKSVGRLQEVTKDEALKSDAYTILNKRYFIAK